MYGASNLRPLAALCLLTTACGVLAFESNPTATHTLLLDFDEFTSSPDWPYRPGQAPPGGESPNAPYTSPELFPPGAPENYDQDQQNDFIWRVWRRVAEDYAPFDVNVVTEAPAEFDSRMENGTAARVAIGGTADDIGGSSGVAPPDGYLRDDLDRNAFARGRNDDQTLRTPEQIARTASHEAAHMYGANYHYVDLPDPQVPANCRATNTPGLQQAHMSRFAGGARDKWWSDIGYGVDADNNPQCGLRGEVGELWNALGRRQPLTPGNAINPLQAGSSGGYLIGHGVVTINQATYGREQIIDWINEWQCGDEPVCELNGIVLGYAIGRGPDSWLFDASAGSVRIRVDTINRETRRGSSAPVDATSANLDVDFSLWVESSGGVSWVQVVPTATRQASDPFSAEVYYTVPHADVRTYSILVKTRDGYGDLGQYRVEAYAGNGNIQEYSAEKWDDGPTIRQPVVVKFVTPTITLERVDIRLDEPKEGMIERR